MSRTSFLKFKSSAVGLHAPGKTTFKYDLWHQQIVSDFDLGVLEGASEACDARAIHILKSSEETWPPALGGPVFEDPFENGDPWFTSWKARDGYIIHFPECAF